MRNVLVLVSAIVTAGVLTACGTASGPVNSPPSGGPVATTPTLATTSNNAIQVPNNPAGTWQRAGDLCRLIPAATAKEVLSYNGTLTAKYSAANLPAIAGKDTCYYTDEQAGYVAALVVRAAVDDQTWNASLNEAKRFGDIRKFTIAGMDDALVSKVNQAAVRKGNLMATTLNSSPGQFRPEGLVKLTALALKVVTP